MGLLYHAIVTKYVYFDGTCSIWLNRNVFVRMSLINIQFLEFLVDINSKLSKNLCPDFWNKWSWVFVSCNCNAIHIIWWNLFYLAHYKCFCSHDVDKKSVFRIFGTSTCKTDKTVKKPRAATFEINGHGASVSWHFNTIHTKWQNLINLVQ